MKRINEPKTRCCLFSDEKYQLNHLKYLIERLHELDIDIVEPKYCDSADLIIFGFSNSESKLEETLRLSSEFNIPILILAGYSSNSLSLILSSENHFERTEIQLRPESFSQNLIVTHQLLSHARVDEEQIEFNVDSEFRIVCPSRLPLAIAKSESKFPVIIDITYFSGPILTICTARVEQLHANSNRSHQLKLLRILISYQLHRNRIDDNLTTTLQLHSDEDRILNSAILLAFLLSGMNELSMMNLENLMSAIYNEIPWLIANSLPIEKSIEEIGGLQISNQRVKLVSNSLSDTLAWMRLSIPGWLEKIKVGMKYDV